MQAIRCSYASLADLDVHEPRAAERWLSPPERRRWQRLQSAERRATWLAGRVLARRMILARLAETGDALPSASDIHIESRSADEAHGERPRIDIVGRPLGWPLSIAHTARGVLVALGREPGVALGVDLVSPVESREGLNWTFTAAERRWLAEDRGRRVEQLWAAKEALYKACQQGEGIAPARIEVVPEVTYPGLDASAVRRLQSWRVDGQFAALAVVERAAAMREQTHPPHPVPARRDHPLPRGPRGERAFEMTLA
jgi:phosphopantetheinyl transferase